MKIGIDIDGVLCFFDEAYQKELNKLEGTNKPYYIPTQWHHEVPEGGFSRDTVETFWDTVAREYGFWYALPPYDKPGSVEHQKIVHLIETHDVYFITKRMSPPKEASEQWLKAQYGAYTTRPLTTIISGAKGHIARGLDLDVMFDDKPANLKHVQEHNPRTKCYLIDRPWNQDSKFDRVATIGEGFDKFVQKGYNG